MSIHTGYYISCLKYISFFYFLDKMKFLTEFCSKPFFECHLGKNELPQYKFNTPYPVDPLILMYQCISTFIMTFPSGLYILYDMKSTEFRLINKFNYDNV